MSALGTRYFRPKATFWKTRAVREQRVVLEHEPQIALVDRQVVDPPPLDRNVALGRVEQAGDHAQRRGLAAARRAEQRDEGRFGDAERHRCTAVKSPKRFTMSLRSTALTRSSRKSGPAARRGAGAGSVALLDAAEGLRPFLLVAVPVGRIGEGQPGQRAGRVEGRQRRDLLAEIDLLSGRAPAGSSAPRPRRWRSRAPA
jgi:hypothetical protein